MDSVDDVDQPQEKQEQLELEVSQDTYFSAVLSSLELKGC